MSTSRRGFFSGLAGIATAATVKPQAPVRLVEVPLMQCVCRSQMEMIAGDEWPHAVRATCHRCNTTVIVPLKTR